MATLTVRGIDDELKSRLRMEAARHGRSMEEEARQILRNAVMGPRPGDDGTTLAERIHRRFAGLRAEDIALPSRQAPRLPPDWRPKK